MSKTTKIRAVHVEAWPGHGECGAGTATRPVITTHEWTIVTCRGCLKQIERGRVIPKEERRDFSFKVWSAAPWQEAWLRRQLATLQTDTQTEEENDR